MEAILSFVLDLYRKHKEWRPQIISMVFSASLALGGFYYFSMKHNEAMAGIKETKASLEESVHRIDVNVRDIYSFLIYRRFPSRHSDETDR